MQCEVIVLGSGTCVPHTERGSAGFYFRIEGYEILLDCGSGVLRQLIKAEKDYKDIDLLIINHLHPDHVSDFPAFIQALNYTPGFKRTKELKVLASEKFKEFYQGLKQAYGGAIKPNSFKIKLLQPGKHKFSGFIVETHQGNHSKSSIMVKFIVGDKYIVYTGDTDYGEKVVDFARGADLLITECSYPEGEYKKGHLIPSLVGKIVSEAKVKKLLITHIYPSADSVNLKNQIKRYFDGNFEIAEDLQRIII